MRGREWSGRELMGERWKAFEDLIDAVAHIENDYNIINTTSSRTPSLYA